MTTVTLLVKASHAWQIRAIDELLKVQFEELDVEAQVQEKSTNRWVQVIVSGEDEAIATSYMNKTFGTCPVNREKAQSLETLKGYVAKVDNAKQELRLDVGIFEPKSAQAIVSVTRLQSQIAEGKKLPLQKIVDLFGIAEGLPLTLKIDWEKSAEEELSAELSMEQAAKFQSWRLSFLDRLIILGASLENVNEVLARTHLERDVINVEALGAFEYALTCKLGTDAAGLIPRLGRYMRNSVFVVFSAEKAWRGMDISGE